TAALAVLFLNGEENTGTVVIFVCLTFLIGFYVSTQHFSIFLKRAAASLNDDEHNALEFHKTKSGLKTLDAFIEIYEKRIDYITETLVSIQNEAEALRERYDSLTDNLAASVVIRDHEGEIVYCSPYTEVLTGYATSEVYECERDFFDSIVHDDDLPKLARAKAVSACGEAFQFRYRFFHKTGIEMWAETRTVPIIDDSGVVTSSLSITLDVTGTVRYQKQVEERNKDLQEFTYMVSHDLKAPIFTIRGMAKILEEDYAIKLGTEGTATVQHILKSTERLQALVNAVVEYSKITAHQFVPQEVSLTEVMEEVLSDLQSVISSNQAKIIVGRNLPYIIGEKTRVYRIISNIVGNALKYRSPDKLPEISIEVIPPINERRVSIAVKDNGLGIPDSRLEDIFRPFQRAHGDEIEGSGIGLASVRKLMHSIGGEVSVSSKLKEGSTFKLTFNRAIRHFKNSESSIHSQA
ncbi:MAG: PAS domain S-box protein, partial [Bdellovibrionales bacterium]|nr:PAS domain S-box protein [Bdellovibrionales bacterium]